MYQEDEDEEAYEPGAEGPPNPGIKAAKAQRAKERAEQAEKRAYRPIPSPTAAEAKQVTSFLGRELFDAIDGMEAQIEACAMILRVAQPPYNGKLDIRWWMPNGEQHREPVLVKWVADARRPGRLQPRRINKYSARVHRRDGLFATNLPEVEKAAALAWELIGIRKELISIVRYKIKTQVAVVLVRESWFEGRKYETSRLMAQVIARLACSGTAVTLPQRGDDIFETDEIQGMAEALIAQERERVWAEQSAQAQPPDGTSVDGGPMVSNTAPAAR